MRQKTITLVLLGLFLVGGLLLANNAMPFFRSSTRSSSSETTTKEGLIKFTTAKKVGETVRLGFFGDETVKVEGLKEPIVLNQTTEYTLASQDIVIRGNITKLDCVIAKITSLELIHCPVLQQLLCSKNLLTSLDLSNCPELVWLTCQMNKLTSIDLSPCQKLKTFDIHENLLTGDLDLSKVPGLQTVYCYDNKLSSINFSKSVDLWKCHCDNNRLTQIDISACGKVIEFWASGNQLTEIDLSHNPYLSNFYCTNNQLTEIDLSKLPLLKRLGASGNKFTKIDVSKNPNLQRMFCSNNLLTEIDLSNNPKLDWIYCYGNRLRGEGLIRTINSLPDRKSSFKAGLFGIHEKKENLNIDPNICTKSDVAVAKARNWTPKFTETREEYMGAEPFKDSYKFTLEVGENGKASFEDVADYNSVPAGKIVKVLAQPNEGFRLDSIYLGTLNITHRPMVVAKDDLTVKVFFIKDPNYRTYAVNLTVGEGGTASIEGAENLAKVAKGTTLTVKVTPNEKYELDKIFAGDKDITKTKTFEVNSDTEVKVTFKKASSTCTVNLKVGEGGTASIEGAEDLSKVARGTTLTVKVTPNEKYELDKIFADDKDITETKRFEVNSDTEVKVTFKKVISTYAVNLKVGEGGTASIEGADNLAKVAEGTTLTVKVTPNEKYELDKIFAGDKDITETKTFEVNSDTEVKVTFKLKDAIDQLEESTLKVYYNSTSGRLTIEGAAANARVRLYSIEGKCLLEAKCDALGSALLDFTMLNRGVYIIQVDRITKQILL